MLDEFNLCQYNITAGVKICNEWSILSENLIFFTVKGFWPFNMVWSLVTKVILCFCEENRMKIAGIIPKILQKLLKKQFFYESLLVENQGFASDFLVNNWLIHAFKLFECSCFFWFSGIYNILLSVRFLFYIFHSSVNLSRICFVITTFLKFPFFTTVEPLRSGDEFQEI